MLEAASKGCGPEIAQVCPAGQQARKTARRPDSQADSQADSRIDIQAEKRLGSRAARQPGHGGGQAGSRPGKRMAKQSKQSGWLPSGRPLPQAALKTVNELMPPVQSAGALPFLPTSQHAPTSTCCTPRLLVGVQSPSSPKQSRLICTTLS